MAQLLTWDAMGERLYEVGVDHGVLYTITNNAYANGYAWNGLISVTESPSGAEATPLYADNIKYLNLISAEEFAATLEAYTYPDEFAVLDGSVEAKTGVMLSQQPRGVFGLCYRTKVGNDSTGQDYGYKLHLVYGLQAAPSERAYSTINDSPEAIAFSWELKSTPVVVEGYSPVSLITIDSTKVDEDDLEAFEAILYGTAEVVAPGTPAPAVPGRLPLPDEVITLLTPQS
jgi:hypothetical protein